MALAVAYMIAPNYTVYTGGLEALETLWQGVHQMLAGQLLSSSPGVPPEQVLFTATGVSLGN